MYFLKDVLSILSLFFEFQYLFVWLPAVSAAPIKKGFLIKPKFLKKKKTMKAIIIVTLSLFVPLMLAQSGKINVWLMAVQICSGQSSWSIHGIWPQYDFVNYPSNCPGPKLNVNDLNPILAQMNQSWFSCQESNDGFWSHEW